MRIGARERGAIEEEAADLIRLARRLADQTQARFLLDVEEQLCSALEKALSAREAEETLEAGARRLRRMWLDLAGAETHETYRSPPSDESVRTPSREYLNFGYERELQPTLLETRSRAFFGPPPEGWAADHVLFSSGQAAMTAALHLLEALFTPLRAPLNMAHVGAYFETAQLLRVLPSLLQVIGSGRQTLDREWKAAADVVLIEPLFFEERFTRAPTSVVIDRLSPQTRSVAPVVIFDDTLLALSADIAGDMRALSAIDPRAVIRIASGLKLFQAGLELANVGIASIYTRGDNPLVTQRLREIRGLLGLGLGFADVAALEAPWFLDRDDTLAYSRSVFSNNEELARAVAGAASSFAVSHPALCEPEARAPFSLFHLPDGDMASYQRLAQRIQAEALRRDILFERGGSFGFRGHRYDAVAPRDGQPFLRVAAGRRRGWSLDGAIQLLSEL